MVLGFKNGASLIMTAFGGTAACSSSMATLATVIKRDLSGMGKFLFVGALVMHGRRASSTCSCSSHRA